MPVFSKKSRAVFKPIIPGRFRVPASNLSGKIFGTSSLSEKLPVPPLIKGLILEAKASVIANPPIP